MNDNSFMVALFLIVLLCVLGALAWLSDYLRDRPRSRITRLLTWLCQSLGI